MLVWAYFCKLIQTLCFERTTNGYDGANLLLLFTMSVRPSEILTSEVPMQAGWNSKLSDTIDGFHKAITQQESFLRMLQGDEGVELENICEEILISAGNLDRTDPHQITLLDRLCPLNTPQVKPWQWHNHHAMYWMVLVQNALLM